MNLTSLAIGKIRHPEKGQKTYFDDQLPGFGLRVSQKSKSYIVMYGPDRRLKTLGRYPDLSLKDARREAMRYLSRSRVRVSNMTLEDARAAFLGEVANIREVVGNSRRLLRKLRCDPRPQSQPVAYRTRSIRRANV